MPTQIRYASCQTGKMQIEIMTHSATTEMKVVSATLKVCAWLHTEFRLHKAIRVEGVRIVVRIRIVQDTVCGL